MSKCVPLLQSICSRSSLRAAKTVRAQMMSMDALLAADPGVRVIHLLRDPRGVASSRRESHDPSLIGKYSLKHNSSQAVRREAIVYCRTAVRDIRVRQLLERRYHSCRETFLQGGGTFTHVPLSLRHYMTAMLAVTSINVGLLTSYFANKNV